MRLVRKRSRASGRAAQHHHHRLFYAPNSAAALPFCRRFSAEFLCIPSVHATVSPGSAAVLPRQNYLRLKRALVSERRVWSDGEERIFPPLVRLATRRRGDGD